MASACVNNVGIRAETFLDCPPFTSFGWLSPRISFSCDFPNEPAPSAVDRVFPVVSDDAVECRPSESPHLEISAGKDFVDFEFRLDDPVKMLPADELFSDGKLVPLHLAPSSAAGRPPLDPPSPPPAVGRPPPSSDGYIFSPKAPRCSSRWRELLGLKRVQNPKSDLQKPSSAASKNPNPRSLKRFLNRNQKSTPSDTSLSLPLLRESSDSEAVAASSRLSLSSSSSGPDHEDLPRLSLDSDKPSVQPIPISLGRNPPRVRVSKPSRVGRRSSGEPIPSRDSPRMNSSGKIVFQSLERSSSSPGSFNGSRPIKYRPMERSYSANVRITPVLNVPVCSLLGSSKSGSVFGLGQIFSPQKREQPHNRSVGGARSSRNDRP
ncbi:hypothetical protein QJS10_CPB21g00997 [Acorus calamus]|uniref:Uncharacterized protein n=1 Tax=Acorus calamus TaxID=4465 RepID=A0AAV9C2W2_ACOCL|nr:hypothetical protein QJS10_CPB21g00997 [Acorus calamus]